MGRGFGNESGALAVEAVVIRYAISKADERTPTSQGQDAVVGLDLSTTQAIPHATGALGAAMYQNGGVSPSRTPSCHLAPPPPRSRSRTVLKAALAGDSGRPAANGRRCVGSNVA